MKAIVKKQFVGFDREFNPGETVDLSVEKIEKLNNAGLGVLLEPDNSSAWPKHLGGGNYELSNGEKVKSKESAHKAQALLDNTENDSASRQA